MKLLIDRGASLEIQDNRGRTPLHIAASSGNVVKAELLLDAGADPYVTTGLFLRETPRDLASNDPYMLQLFDERGIEDLSYFEKLFH